MRNHVTIIVWLHIQGMSSYLDVLKLQSAVAKTKIKFVIFHKNSPHHL